MLLAWKPIGLGEGRRRRGGLGGHCDINVVVMTTMLAVTAATALSFLVYVLRYVKLGFVGLPGPSRLKVSGKKKWKTSYRQ